MLAVVLAAEVVAVVVEWDDEKELKGDNLGESIREEEEEEEKEEGSS